MKSRTFFALGMFTIGLSISAQSLPEAIKLTQKEQFEKADAAFRTLVTGNPANAEAWYYRGESYFANDRLDSALLSYETGITANAVFPLNYAGKGKVLRAQGKVAEATVQLDKALALTGDKTNKFTKPAQSDAYRAVAAALIEGKDKQFTAAQGHLAKAIELDPKDPANYILRGDAYFEADPRDGTTPLENYKQAINLDALDPLPVARKAFMYYRANNFNGSIQEYTNAIAIDAGFAPAYRGRAEAYLKARKFTEAAADMNKYLELNSGSMSARVRNAQFLFLVGKYDESLTEIGKLEAAGVKDLTLLRIKGYDLVEKGDTVNAKTALDSYFAQQAADKVLASDHEYYGKALVLAGQDSAGAEAMLKGARMDRTKDFLYMEAGKTFTAAKAYNSAIQAYQEKIAAKPEVNDWYYLGNVASRAKRFGLADSAWTQYISKQPNIYQGYLYRARAKAATDTADVKTWVAKADYEEVLRKMKPEEQEKSKADYEEALNYMGLYYLYDKTAMDRPKAKCYFEKVSALGANTSITKQVNEVFLKMKELKDVTPSACEIL